MSKKNLEIYSQGIHIEKLENEELKIILREYYDIKYLPKMPFQSSLYSEKIEYVYNWALYILLLNGYRLPLFRIGAESINPMLYFQDMLMLLYIYSVNKKGKLSANKLYVTPATITFLKDIEQSGFGNVLGLRRENKEKIKNGIHKDYKKQVQFMSTFSHEYLKNVKEGTLKNDKTMDDANKIERRKTKNKFDIPYVCQDVVTALIKSRKYSSFILPTEKNLKFSKEEIENFTNVDGSGDIWDVLPLLLFEKEVRDNFMCKIVEGGKGVNNLFKYFYSKDVNYENEYKFYNKYYCELDKAEKSRENYKEDIAKEGKKQRKLANQYLTETIFAYSFYERVIARLHNITDKQIIDDKVLKKFMDVVYQVSESPACFSREEHFKCYWKKFYSVISNKNKYSEKEIWKVKNHLIRNEKYTIHKFLPALFYCLIYYMEDAKLMNKEFSSLKEYLAKSTYRFERLNKRSFDALFKNSRMKRLWIKRKTEFLKPYVYEIKKALF